jgi:hypothetical protein
MVPAATLKSILEREGARAPAGGTQPDAPGLTRLVSILFADPHTAVVSGLQHNRALYDAISDIHWDLYVAGYYAYGGEGYDPVGYPVAPVAGDVSGGNGGRPPVEWWFGPNRFTALQKEVVEAHAECLKRAPRPLRRAVWNPTGRPELVNFWMSGSTPDWESLVSCEVSDEGPSAVGSIVTSHTDWRTDVLQREYRPGTRPRVAAEVLHADALRRALSWAVAGAAGAALSEGATALVHELTRLF